jgi:hypothetical protein
VNECASASDPFLIVLMHTDKLVRAVQLYAAAVLGSLLSIIMKYLDFSDLEQAMFSWR